MRKIVWILLVLMTIVSEVSSSQSVKIVLARGTKGEKATKSRLEQVLSSYDLSKYTFTRKVMIKGGARNHAIPVLTLNVRFANSADELLSSYIHEQIHWHLRNHGIQQRHAVAELRRMYPTALVGLPYGAQTAYSTYGHLVTCYLEVQALRALLTKERAAKVIHRKRNYLWIYKTVISDEEKIKSVVRRYGLDLE
jgi:hypothetical protein